MSIRTENPIRIIREGGTIIVGLTSGDWRHTDWLTCDGFHCDLIWSIAAAFITSSCRAHEGVFTDAFAVSTGDVERIDGVVGTVHVEDTVMDGGAVGFVLADPSNSIDI